MFKKLERMRKMPTNVLQEVGEKETEGQLDVLFDPAEKDLRTESLNWNPAASRPQTKHVLFNARG